MDFQKTTVMTEFERRVFLYKMGHFSEAQWNALLQEPMFGHYVEIRFGK